jgi:hypothetical protein
MFFSFDFSFYSFPHPKNTKKTIRLTQLAEKVLNNLKEKANQIKQKPL